MMETSLSAKWTVEDIKTLLTSMKHHIANRERHRIWSVGVKKLDWGAVSFKHYSPEECCKKWNEMMQKLPKIKTLTELIDDAQCAINSSDSKIDLIESTQIKLPKKPVSPNALYFADTKDKLKKTNPGLSSRELMALANDMFKELSPEEQYQYFMRAQQTRDEYHETVDNLRRLHPNEMKKVEKSVNKRKGKTQTKDKAQKKDSAQETNSSKVKTGTPNLNGYNLFCREQKSKMAGVRWDRMTKVFSKRWKKLSEAERDQYSERCQEIKMTWKKPNKRMFPGEPKLPSRSVCGLYCKTKMAEVKGKKGNQQKLFAVFSRQSKSMSKQERQRFQAEIDKNLNAYKKTLQNWFETLTPSEQTEYCSTKPAKLKYLQSNLLSSYHRTSDSEDESLEDSSSDDDLIIVEDDSESEEEDKPMFELF